MGKKIGVSVKVDEVMIEQIDVLATAQKRDRTFIINEAIENYLEIQNWQIEQIKKAIVEAANGEFASNEEISKVLSRWQS